MNTQESKDVSDKAFKQFLDTFGFKKVKFRGREIYKFESTNVSGVLAGVTQCHESIYRVLLASHMSCIPTEDRMEHIEKFRAFVNSYLDRATNEFIEAHSKGEMIGATFGVVK